MSRERLDNKRCSGPFNKTPLLQLSLEPQPGHREEELQGDLFVRKARAVSSPDRLQQPDMQGCFLGPADSTVDKRDQAAALALEGCTGSSADRRWEEVTVVGLRVSGDVVAPKDSLAVESWSLRKMRVGNESQRVKGNTQLLTGCFGFCLSRRKRVGNGERTLRLASCSASLAASPR